MAPPLAGQQQPPAPTALTATALRIFDNQLGPGGNRDRRREDDDPAKVPNRMRSRSTRSDHSETGSLRGQRAHLEETCSPDRQPDRQRDCRRAEAVWRRGVREIRQRITIPKPGLQAALAKLAAHEEEGESATAAPGSADSDTSERSDPHGEWNLPDFERILRAKVLHVIDRIESRQDPGPGHSGSPAGSRFCDSTRSHDSVDRWSDRFRLLDEILRQVPDHMLDPEMRPEAGTRSRRATDIRMHWRKYIQFLDRPTPPISDPTSIARHRDLQSNSVRRRGGAGQMAESIPMAEYCQLVEEARLETKSSVEACFRTMDLDGFSPEERAIAMNHDSSSSTDDRAADGHISALPDGFPPYHRVEGSPEMAKFLSSSSYVISLGGRHLGDLKYGIIIVPEGEERLLFHRTTTDQLMTAEFKAEVCSKSMAMREREILAANGAAATSAAAATPAPAAAAYRDRRQIDQDGGMAAQPETREDEEVNTNAQDCAVDWQTLIQRQFAPIDPPGDDAHWPPLSDPLPEPPTTKKPEPLAAVVQWAEGDDDDGDGRQRHIETERFMHVCRLAQFERYSPEELQLAQRQRCQKLDSSYQNVPVGRSRSVRIADDYGGNDEDGKSSGPPRLFPGEDLDPLLARRAGPDQGLAEFRDEGSSYYGTTSDSREGNPDFRRSVSIRSKRGWPGRLAFGRDPYPEPYSPCLPSSPLEQPVSATTLDSDVPAPERQTGNRPCQDRFEADVSRLLDVVDSWRDGEEVLSRIVGWVEDGLTIGDARAGPHTGELLKRLRDALGRKRVPATADSPVAGAAEAAHAPAHGLGLQSTGEAKAALDPRPSSPSLSPSPPSPSPSHREGNPGVEPDRVPGHGSDSGEEVSPVTTTKSTSPPLYTPVESPLEEHSPAKYRKWRQEIVIPTDRGHGASGGEEVSPITVVQPSTPPPPPLDTPPSRPLTMCIPAAATPTSTNTCSTTATTPADSPGAGSRHGGHQQLTSQAGATFIPVTVLEGGGSGDYDHDCSRPLPASTLRPHTSSQSQSAAQRWRRSSFFGSELGMPLSLRRSRLRSSSGGAGLGISPDDDAGSSSRGKVGGVPGTTRPRPMSAFLVSGGEVVPGSGGGGGWRTKLRGGWRRWRSKGVTAKGGSSSQGG